MLAFDASRGRDWRTPSDAPHDDFGLLPLLQLVLWLLLLLLWPARVSRWACRGGKRRIRENRPSEPTQGVQPGGFFS